MLHICYQYNDNSNKTHSKHSLNFVNVGSNDSTKDILMSCNLPVTHNGKFVYTYVSNQHQTEILLYTYRKYHKVKTHTNFNTVHIQNLYQNMNIDHI